MGLQHEDQQQPALSESSSEESSRAVRFGDDALIVQVQIYDPGDAPNEELWFTEQEYVEIKAKSRSDAREWRRQGYAVLLQDVYSLHTAGTAQDFITAFVQLDGPHLHRRGLERYCCPEHGEDRSAAKERARDAVFVTQYRAQQQQQQQQQQTESRKKQALLDEERAERIAAAYALECREARIFARRLGKADELVALDIPTDNHKCMVGLLGPSSGRGRTVQRRMSNLSIHSNGSVDSRQVAQRHKLQQQQQTTSRNLRPQQPQPRPPRSPPKKSSRNGNISHRAQCPKSPDSAVEELYAAIA